MALDGVAMEKGVEVGAKLGLHGQSPPISSGCGEDACDERLMRFQLSASLRSRLRLPV
jgi:hypothetical protein